MPSIATLAALPWKWIGLATAALLLVVAAVAGIKGYAEARYRAGVSDERAIWDQAVADQNRRLAEAERQADNNLAEGRASDAAAAVANQQEIDNATADIPDQVPSARQRVRACLELRRQGQEPAACNLGPAH